MENNSVQEIKELMSMQVVLSKKLAIVSATLGFICLVLTHFYQNMMVGAFPLVLYIWLAYLIIFYTSIYFIRKEYGQKKGERHSFVERQVINSLRFMTGMGIVLSVIAYGVWGSSIAVIGLMWIFISGIQIYVQGAFANHNLSKIGGYGCLVIGIVLSLSNTLLQYWALIFGVYWAAGLLTCAFRLKK